MAIQKYSGPLTMIGNGQRSGKLTMYTLVEIGDSVVKELLVDTALDNFLSRAIKQDGDTILYLQGNVLIGLELPDGKIYILATKESEVLKTTLLGIALLPVLIGFLFLFNIRPILAERLKWSDEMLSNNAIDLR